MRPPLLLLGAFVAELVALVVVAIVASPAAAKDLQLDTIAVAFAGALAGASIPGRAAH